MHFQRRAIVFLIATSLASTFVFGAHCLAQPGQSQSQVSVVTLKTTMRPGQQMVVLPSRQQVPLPGPGVKGNTVDIYCGSQGGYWYVDRNGENFDLTSYVEKMTVEQNSGDSSGSSNNSGSSSSNGDTAAAAAGGAMAGAYAAEAYNEYQNQYQVPYGVAVFGGGGAGSGPYYTGSDGNNVYVNNNVGNNNSGGNPYGANLAKQEQWYTQQRQGDPQRFAKGGGRDNPFVAKGGAGEHGRPTGGPFGGGGGPFGGAGPFGHGKPGGAMEAGGAQAGSGGPPFGGHGGPSGSGGPPHFGRGEAPQGAPGGISGGGMSGGPSGAGPSFGGKVPSGGPPARGGGAPSGGPPVHPGPGPH